jgi:hypothetical protein
MSTVPVPEVRTMVAAAQQFVAGNLHFSALVGPISDCEWWARVHNADSAIHRLASEWLVLADRTWNEFSQHNDALSVEDLRTRISDDLGSF